MNIKKIGIASALGFLTQFAVGAVPKTGNWSVLHLPWLRGLQEKAVGNCFCTVLNQVKSHFPMDLSYGTIYQKG